MLARVIRENSMNEMEFRFYINKKCLREAFKIGKSV